MRRLLILIGCGVALMVLPVWAQSVFDVLNGTGSTFNGTIHFPDGSVLSPTGMVISPSSSFTAPDTTTWGSSGIIFAPTGVVTLPDRSTVNASGISIAAAATFKGPDASAWNNGGIMMSAGKQFSLANGTSAAPSLSFTSQATAGLYREAVDDLRMVLSGSIPALRIYKASSNTGVASVPLGASTGYAVVGGRICTSTTSAATTGTTIQTLASCPIPVSALSVDGMGLKVKAWGQTAANANSKTLAIHFGGTVCSTLTSTVNNGAMVVESTILRTGAATQECVGTGISGAGTANGIRATPAEDTTASITLAIKATTATAIGDFTFKGVTVEVLN